MVPPEAAWYNPPPPPPAPPAFENRPKRPDFPVATHRRIIGTEGDIPLMAPALLLAFTTTVLQGSEAPTRSAIDLSSARGLAYLAQKQFSDGRFDTPHQVASQGLAGLAFLSCGHTPRHGPHAVRMRLGLRALLGYQNPQGYFDDGQSMMYGHGFATLYLAQVLGMWGSAPEEEQLRDALRKAIRLIERAQTPSGGWHSQPTASGFSDCSITVCQTMALRAARTVGLQVAREVIDKAFDYIREAQAESGGFRYQIGPDRPAVLRQVTIGCSAAGVCILHGLGEYDTQRVRRGLDFLKQHYRMPLLAPASAVRSPFFYTHYYASQAFFGTHGPDWERYYAYAASEVLSRQRADGSWFEQHGGGDIPPTAMAIFILNVPRAVLPITER